MTTPTPTPPDFRALAAELVEAWTKGLDIWGPMTRARAALEAQPEQVEPTDAELITVAEEAGLCYPVCWDLRDGEVPQMTYLRDFARAVLARWGRPAIEPIPVSERLPGPEDCGPGGICWLWDPVRRIWHLTHSSYLNPGDFWLPHWALSIPRSEEILSDG
jgi:hypothetical protein